MLLVGAALRLPALSWGFLDDELALLAAVPLSRVAWQPEVGINPPLPPLLLNALLPHEHVLAGGRAAAVALSVASCGLAWALARRLSGSALAALAAGLAFATHPRLVVPGVLVRSYALWVPLALVHLLALSALLAGGRGRRAWLATAALLPWVHYVSLPLLAVEAAALAASARGRHLLRAARWAPVAWAPLAVMLVTFAGARRSRSDPAEVLALLATAGVSPPGDDVVTAITVGGLLLALARWRALAPGERALALAAAAVWPAALLATSSQSFRPPAIVFLLTPLVPLVASAAGWPARARPWAATLLGGALVVVHLLPRHPWDTTDEDLLSLPEIAATWRAYDGVRGGRDVLLEGRGQVWRLYQALTGRSLPRDRHRFACAAPCFVVDGVTFRAVDPAGDDGLLLEEPGLTRFTPPPGCALVAEGPHHRSWDCRPTAADAPPRDAPRALR